MRTYGAAPLQRVGCGPDIQNQWPWIRDVLFDTKPAPFYQRVSLIGRFAGLSLADLVAAATQAPEPSLPAADDIHRAKAYLLRIKAEHPAINRVQLRARRLEAVRLINSTDPKWFRDTFPARRNTVPRSQEITELDEHWRNQIVAAHIDELREQHGQWPKRISKNTLARRSGLTAKVWSQRRQYLVKTMEALRQLAETDTQYVSRRSEFAAREFRRDGRCYSFETFKNCAGVLEATRRCSSANEAAYSAWQGAFIASKPGTEFLRPAA